MIGNDLHLIPYVEVEGAWSLSDPAMRHVWDRMTKERKHIDVFHSGGIVDEKTFISFAKSRKYAVVMVWTIQDVVFMAWLSDIREHTAFAHFCTFRGVPREKKIEAARMVTDYWLGFQKTEGHPWFSVICGVIPACNELAVKFVEEVGWSVAGRIPKLIRHHYRQEDVDAVMVYKEQENGRRR